MHVQHIFAFTCEFKFLVKLLTMLELILMLQNKPQDGCDVHKGNTSFPNFAKDDIDKVNLLLHIFILIGNSWNLAMYATYAVHATKTHLMILQFILRT